MKFIRWAQSRIEKTGSGILGFITNHGYIDNPTFRRMRKSLTETFNKIYIYDLHGNVKKKEKAPDGSKDENVFDIQQGVAIGIFSKSGKAVKSTINLGELFGEREKKYSELSRSSIQKSKHPEISPVKPFYFFKEFDSSMLEEYESCRQINKIFPLNSVGIVTARDKLTIHYSKEKMWETVQEFASLNEEEARDRFKLGKDSLDWKVKLAQEDIKDSGITKKKIPPVLYRPFDVRHTYYTGNSGGFICRPRSEVMRHMLIGGNTALITSRMTKGESFKHIQVTREIVEVICMSPKTSNNGFVFPLYLYPSDNNNEKTEDLSISPWQPGKDGRLPNLDPMFVDEFSAKLGLEFVSDGWGDLKKTFGPEDILHYIYAVFHSPTYRERYSEFLRIDFPRVPLTSDRDLFGELCNKGSALVRLHLLEEISSADLATRFPVTGDAVVEKGYPKYMKPGDLAPEDGKDLEAGRVYINKTQYFDIVNKEVWEFHIGGYQVLSKWLKDRRGRTLDYDDIIHYQKVVFSLGETVRLMNEIDSAIPKWPIT